MSVFLAFLAGLFASALWRWLTAPSQPPAPRCTAVLQSGERCVYDAEHDGPHKTTIYLSPRRREFGPTQDYVWEDPEAGLHDVGWFPP